MYGPKITPVTQPPSFASQSYSQPQHVRPASQAIQPLAKNVATTDLGRSFSQQPSYLQQKQPQQSPGQKQAPARPPPPNLQTARQPFHTIPEPALQNTRALQSSSPEVANRRYTTQVHMPSSDPVHTTGPQPVLATRSAKEPMTLSQIPLHIQARANPPVGQGVSRSAGASRSPSQFNDVVEMRLKSSRDDRPRSQQKIPKKMAPKSSLLGNSDDSLDELIESNIQYLDTEIDRGKAKRNFGINVSRSSSLPDPRRISGHVSSAPSLHEQQPSIQVQASTSIQFHVSLPTDSFHSANHMATPVIQIAPSSAMGYQSNYGYINNSQLRAQPDVVPRKYSYDSHSRLSRPSSEYYDKDDLSKSDSQLNAQVVVPSYLSNSLHPDQAYARGCVSDLNLRSSTGMGNTLQSPQMDKGMFSDVEYDIEVSERVKKWETKMKQDSQVGGDKKNLNLTTIDENEGEPLMLPSEVRKSVLLNKGDFGSPYQQDVTYTPPTRPRPFSSDTSIHRVGEAGGPKVFSLETNAHRFFQVIQDPQSGPRLGIQSQSVSSVFQTPVTIRPEKTFLSASELRQQMLSNRQPALPSTSGPMPATYQPALPHASSYQSTPQKDSLVVKRPNTLTDVRDASKRGSRYKEELDEISSVKTDSVVNLRRRFDTDSATVTSEDDQKSVSVASTKLKRPSKQSPSHKDSDVDVSKMLPRYQQKFKDSDVWSPNLESTQGVPVSIERVTARTLQTIPFSEDPFWKEIEEMTSFDPASMAGHLSVSSTQDTPVNLEPVRSQHQVELSAPHSSTLPNQPRNNVMSARERMQRSKSLYTPNITPLSINVNDKSSSSAVSALDDVLDDISRSSMERKQMSPKKRVMDSDIIASTAAATANAPSFRFEGGQFTFTKPAVPTQPQPAKPYDSGKQPLQFYQQQRQHQQQQQQPNRQSQMLPGGVNNYQLDPDLLKQKLLSTGLVVETDTEEAAPEQHQYRRSSLGATPTGFKPFSTAGTSYTTITTQSNTANLRPGDIRKMASIFTPLQSNVPSVVTTTMSTAGPVKPSGTSALDDIQKALAPFTTAYQPGPESLYGTARFESFKEPSLDTSRGPNTKPTGWAYQPQLGRDQEGIRSNDGSLSSTSTSTLQQVNESMDDLKDLAQNVERRINVIRSKLQAADERSLDSILTSLRKLNPEAKPQDSEPSSFEDYYTVKKSKLSAALSELDRIYDSLELNSEGLSRPTERGKYKPYRHSKSSDYILGSQVKSEHVQPAQTKISSFFIPNLEDRTRKELDKETESEFDVLSKSFQAIIDEVNQTTDLFTRAAERNKQENTAPETQKQTFKITLKPGETVAGSTSSTKPVGSDDTATATPYKAAPATAPKPQDKSKGGRFRSKLPEATADDDVSSTKPRSKSVPGMDSNTAELLGSALQKAANASVVPKSTVSSTTTVTASTAPAPASTPPPATRQRTRVRPVRDNRIIQDDRAARRDSSEKVLGMPPSPQPSPKVSRKIIYNSGVDLDVKLQPPEMFQDAPGKPTQEPPLNQPQSGSGAKLQAQMAEDRFIYKPPEADIKPASVASPSSVKKIPPPTAAKPSIKTEISVPAPASPTRASAPVPLPGKSEPEQTTTGGRKLLVSDSSVSSGLNLSSSASTASINLSPPVFDSNQPKPLLASPKQDVQDSESSSSGGRKSKRRLGMGVAMMLDKFNTEDGGDKLKKRLGTRSAPDLTGNVNEEGKDGDDKAKTKSTEQTGPKVTTVVKTEAQLSPSHLKSPTGKAEEKSPPVFVIDSKNVTPVAKSAVISSLERKVIDPEGRAPSSGTSSPQPSSPCSKPPHHPWKRQTSDPDKQSVSDAIESSSSMGVGSPTMVSKITKTIGSPPPVTATLVSDDGPATSGTVTPSQEPESPRSAAKRVRPPDRKIQTGSGAATERPHSFHELFSCFERDPNKLESMDKFRRSASADAVNCGATGDKVFRSERNISHKVKPGDGHKDSEVVFKFALKVKS